MVSLLRLASSIQFDSILDGVGLRCVIWTQGCKHDCSGCHNPQTHAMQAGTLMDIQEVAASILEHSYLDGVTFSGGEPFLQVEALSELAMIIKKSNLTIWCYTGFYFEDLSKEGNSFQLLKHIDVLVDGPFILEQRSLANKFRGSSNQRLIDVQKSIKLNDVTEYSIS